MTTACSLLVCSIIIIIMSSALVLADEHMQVMCTGGQFFCALLQLFSYCHGDFVVMLLLLCFICSY